MNIDLVIFLVFLSINLAVGLYWGRGVKNIKEYAIGKRNFSTSTLVATVVATFLGGDYLFITLDEVYTTGLHYAIGCLGMPVAILIAAYLFIPRMGEFFGDLSVAESIGKIYGKEVRVITGICGAICVSGFIAVQFRVFGSSMGYVVGISPDMAIILAAMIVIFYSAFGGIRSVTFTDVVQFITFGMIIPVIAFKVWFIYVGGHSFDISNMIHNKQFNYKEYLDTSSASFWKVTFLLVLFLIPEFNPSMYQRIIIGRSMSQVRKAFSISGLIIFLVLLSMSWIAFLLYNIDNNLNPKELVQYIITQDFHQGFRGLIIIGIVAMAMSTADSNINTSSVLITHDVLQPMKLKIFKELTMAKIVALSMGILSIFLAFSKFDLLELVFFTQDFYIPIISPIMLTIVLGFRSSKRVALSGIIAGLIATFGWRYTYMEQTGIYPVLIGLPVNLITMFTVHYLFKENGGWVGIKDSSYVKSERENRKRRWNQFITSIKTFSLVQFCKSKAPKNEMTYTSFGIFSIVSVFATMYSGFNIIENHTNMLRVYELIIIASLFFATYPIWPHKIKKEIIVQMLWLVAVLMILVVIPTVFLLMTHFSRLQLVVFSLNLLVALLLTRGKLGLSLLFLGVYLGVKIFDIYLGGYKNELSEFSTLFYLVYALLMISAVFVILLRPNFKREEIDRYLYDELELEYKEQKSKILRLSQTQEDFVSKIDKMVIQTFNQIQEQAIKLHADVTKAENESQLLIVAQDLLMASEKLKDSSTYLSKIINQVTKKLKIELSKINITDLLKEISTYIKKVYNKNVDYNISTKHIEFDCDNAWIKKILIIISKVTNDGVQVEDGVINFEIELFKGKKTTIDAEAIKFVFTISDITLDKIEKEDLKTIEKVISAHYGKLEFNNEGEYLKFNLYIPAFIKELRPKFMDMPDISFHYLAKIDKALIQERQETLEKVAQRLYYEGMSVKDISKITKIDQKKLEQYLDVI